MCEVIKDKMKPGTKLFLDGEINDTGFELRAPYRGEIGLSFGMGFVLEDAVFCVRVDPCETQIFIEGLMKISDPELQFKGMYVNKSDLLASFPLFSYSPVQNNPKRIIQISTTVQR